MNLLGERVRRLEGGGSAKIGGTRAPLPYLNACKGQNVFLGGSIKGNQF